MQCIVTRCAPRLVLSRMLDESCFSLRLRPVQLCAAAAARLLVAPPCLLTAMPFHAPHYFPQSAAYYAAKKKLNALRAKAEAQVA